MQIFPGNTKGQGWHMYNLPNGWQNKKQVTVNGKSYKVIVSYHIKFMHFNKYVTSVDFPVADKKEFLRDEIVTWENQHKLAGKWDRNKWEELDKKLSSYFTFDWKEDCEFDRYFTDTDRTYLTLALGYSVNLFVPYTDVQEIDISQSDYTVVGQFLKDCRDALVALVEG